MPIPQVAAEFRVAADPEIRFAQSGVAVGRVRLVASSQKREGDQWVDDKTFWITGKAFAQTAENMVESVQKGDLVNVIGKIHTEEWEQDGQKRSANVLLIDSIGRSLRFGATPHSGAQNAPQGAPQQQRAPQQQQAPQQGQQQQYQQPPQQQGGSEQQAWGNEPPF